MISWSADRDRIIDHFHVHKQMHGLTNAGDESFNAKLKS